MPIRFSTQAANADRISGDDDDKAIGADGPPRDKADRTPEVKSRTDAAPGKDINAAGFLKGKDSPKPQDGS